MLAYLSSIDLFSSTLQHLAEQLAGRRREIGTRWRRLPAGRQALLALAHLRCGDTYAQLVAGFGIGIVTVYRYIREAIEVLAARAPTLATAMETARTKAVRDPGRHTVADRPDRRRHPLLLGKNTSGRV